ncbi:hypothetical protein FDI24_gp114 [Acidovorax phage ACP17]|uniref:Uncharacterized protein n=1 Tax=Acidovorax phage ACP17 TaxID=2010329 RepID=A0A218M2X7_9CAUD|nr:hypothetical protein FDI24_gp114 [Acidovorax phage ACP17]ASD50394.1 hypothetical protein [Acidovorax phage ACP17]
MMGKVAVFFTTQGQIVAEIVDVAMVIHDNMQPPTSWTVKNPVLAILNGTGLQFVPLTQTVKEKEFTILARDLMFGGHYTPLDPIANKYKEMFGGVQTYDASALSMLAAR